MARDNGVTSLIQPPEAAGAVRRDVGERHSPPPADADFARRYAPVVPPPVAAYRAGYAPFVPETYFAPYPTRTSSAAACLSFLDSLCAHAVPPDEVAAVLVEPVQGEGGVVIPPAAFLRGLRERCDRYGIALI